jgi:hypothetical protein
VLSGMRFFPVWHVEPFALLFQNFRYRAAFYAPLICNVLLPNSRVLLVVEAYFFTLMIEEPLLAGFADEFLKSISSRIFERLPIKLRWYASSLSETSDGRCDAVCRRDRTGTEGRTRE